MYKIVLFCLALALVCRAEDQVLELTDDNFSTTLSERDTTLVMFYAPWCGHCKRLKPEYSKAAELVRDDDPKISLAKVY
uniref:protein disulfide-isomerase n=1 Tax=Glossina palpalis gambiensis TaxID=67801 RepID=A0A1B0AKH7_9MUSC